MITIRNVTEQKYNLYRHTTQSHSKKTSNTTRAVYKSLCNFIPQTTEQKELKKTKKLLIFHKYLKAQTKDAINSQHT